MKIAIVGGGIAGLSAAYYLSKQARESGRQIDIVLLDSADYWGGKIKTVVEDEFVVEGGPDAYLVTKPELRALARELGLEHDLQGTNPEFTQTFILNRGELEPIPTGLTMTIPTEFGPMLKTKLITWPQKIRMGLDFIIPPNKKNSDESLAGFISRRLGRAAYEWLVGPLLSGIYAGDGDRLSLQSTFPSFREMEIEHGGLIKGALALRAKRAAMAIQRAISSNGAGKKRPTSIFESPRSGLASLVDAIVDQLEAAGLELRLSTPVQKVTQTETGYKLELKDKDDLDVDGLVLATPAYVSGTLLNEIAPTLAGELGKIEYVTTATVSLAYLKEELPTKLKGYGYIVPQQEDSKVLACTWTSSKWQGRAPQQYALLRVFIGRIQDAHTLPHEPAELIEIAREELLKTMHIKAKPLNSWVFRWEKAMPQYNLGHPERLQRIATALEAFPNLALAGNGYRGIGMPDCIHTGIDAAEKIMRITEEEQKEYEYSKVS